MAALFFAIAFYLSTSYAQDPVSAPPTAQEDPAPVTAPPAQAPTEVTPEPTPAPAPAEKTASSDGSLPGDSAVGKVSQIFRDKKKVVLTIDPKIKTDALPGNLVFTNKKGESCEGKVTQLEGDKAFVDFANCSVFEQIASGTIIKTSIFKTETPAEPNILVNSQPVEAKSPPEPARERRERPKTKYNRPRFSVALSYSSIKNAKFDSATYTVGGNSADVSSTYDFDTAKGLTLGVMVAEPHHWGFLGTYTIEESRNINSLSMTSSFGGTTSANYLSPKPTIQFNILEMNALYRWGVVFLPFGLNYAVPTITPGGSGYGSVTATGGVGAQVGVGFLAGEYWHFEIYAQALTSKVKISNSSYSADLGTGAMSGLVFRVGLNF